MTQKHKVSIITIVKNGMPNLPDALESFKKQSYKNKELIIVYSKSDDKTLKILKSSKIIKKIVYQNKPNLYNAINLGLKNVSGDVIGILHCDDIFFSSKSLEIVMKNYIKDKFDVAYGNILISEKNNLEDVIRNWKSKPFKKNNLNYGWMPPHVSIFISNRNKNITYNKNYKISADYLYILKILNKSKIIRYIDSYITIMRTGGASSNHLLKFREDLSIAKKYFKYYLITIILKIISKVNQYKPIKINFDKKYINSFKNDKYKFTNNINNIIKHKRFILSAFNLAYLAFVHNKINIKKKNIYLWPDGITSKIFLNKKKIPGRLILRRLKNDKSFQNVYLINKKSNIDLNYIKKKFPKKNIYNIEASYGPTNLIIRTIRDRILKIKNKSLIIIALPTPKQEIIAAYISNIHENYKIVCIGGALDFESKKLKIPILFSGYLESIWRLKYETFRRLNRLLLSIFIVYKRWICREYKNF
jgi:glycosyltransferase involved in cell wall biosynthesis